MEPALEVLVSVTATDIKAGRPRSSMDCPVAIAVRRAFGREWGVSVSSASIYVDPYVYYVPLSVVSFISTFDLGGDVQPFEFVTSYQPQRVNPLLVLRDQP